METLLVVGGFGGFALINHVCDYNLVGAVGIDLDLYTWHVCVGLCSFKKIPTPFGPYRDEAGFKNMDDDSDWLSSAF